MSAGVRVAVRRAGWLPLVALRLWTRGGARCEEIPGLAAVAGRCLAEGSRRRDWRRIAEDAERKGAWLVSDGGMLGHGVIVEALAADWRRALEWAGELAEEPAFPPERCAWVVRRAQAELASLADRPDEVTGWAFLAQLYGDHAAGRPSLGDAASLERLDPGNLAGFHRRSRRRGTVVAVAGDIDPEEVAAAVRERLSGASADGARPDGEADEEPPSPRQAEPGRREVRLGGEVEQAHLFAGRLTVERASPDHAALRLLGVVLGAGPGLVGRLPERIREREGLAYSVEVATVAGAGLDPGRLAIYVGTDPGRVGRAERAVREELGRLAATGPTPEELEEARAYLLGREPFRRQTARQWCGLLLGAELLGLPLETEERVRRELGAVDLAAAAAAARRYLDPAELRVTVGLPGHLP